MKTSNLLMLLFLILTVVVTSVGAVNIIKYIREYKEQSTITEGDYSKMHSFDLKSANELSINASSACRVKVLPSTDSVTHVMVQDGFKDSIKVEQVGAKITISTLSKSHAIALVVRINGLANLLIDNAASDIAGFKGDSFSFKATGNSAVQIKGCQFNQVDFFGDGNASVQMVDTDVKNWNIKMDGNANISGVSPNSKLSMSVLGNAKVDLSR